MTNLVLKDHANADHTFTPNDITGNVAAFIESTGIPIGDPRLTVGRATTAQGKRKLTLKVAIPELSDQTVNGATRKTVVRTAYVDITFTFDGASTADERMKALMHAYTLMGTSMTNDVVVKLQGLY